MQVWVGAGSSLLFCEGAQSEAYALRLFPQVRSNLLVIGALASVEGGAVHREGQLLVWTCIGLRRLVVFCAERKSEVGERKRLRTRWQSRAEPTHGD